MIVKTHHAFGDGLAVSTLLLSLSKYDSSALPGLKPMGFLQSLIIDVCMIYRVPLDLWKFLVTEYYVPPNSIRQGNKLTGIKKVGVSAEFKLDSFKQMSKKNGCSLNDYASALVSNGLYEYFDKNQKLDGV